MKNENYYTTRNIQDIDKIGELLQELPPFCEDYFLGIESRTSCQTRVKYAYDLRIFFDFLCKRRFKNYQITELTLEQLDTVTHNDIELFVSYLSHYQFRGITSGTGDYMDLMPEVLKEWDYMREDVGKPFFPHVSIGWDNNPRYMTFRPDIMTGCNPQVFEYALRKAKEYSDTYNETPLITVNSWNEWTETSYLEPDDVNGYGYLEAIRRVFKGE